MPPPGTPRAHGPVGTYRRPRNVVLAGIFTLTVYLYVWWWKTSAEIDAFARPDKPSHKMIRTYVILTVILLFVYLLFGAAFIAFIAQTASDPGAFEGSEGPPAFFWVLWAGMLLIGFPLGILGFVFLILGAFRMWDEIRQAQQRLGHREPLNMALMFVLLLVPYINIVGMWIMMYKTQEALNGIWSRSRPAASPMPR